MQAASRHRNVERRHHGCENLFGNPGTEEQLRENEQTVVDPKWRDGVSDRLTLPFGARPERQQLPYPPAKSRRPWSARQ